MDHSAPSPPRPHSPTSEEPRASVTTRAAPASPSPGLQPHARRAHPDCGYDNRRLPGKAPVRESDERSAAGHPEENVSGADPAHPHQRREPRPLRRPRGLLLIREGAPTPSTGPDCGGGPFFVAGTCHLHRRLPPQHLAWAVQVYRQLTGNWQLSFHACSGAVISDYYAPNHNGKQNLDEDLSQQSWLLTAVTPNPAVKLVTFTFGGNDAGFADIVTTCVDIRKLPTFNCTGRLTQAAKDLPAIAGPEGSKKPPQYTLADLYAQVRRDAPKAKILVVGYPRFFPDNPPRVGCGGGGGDDWSQQSMRQMNALVDQANSFIRADATHADARLTYVDISDVLSPGGTDHTVCSNHANWLNRAIPTNAQLSYHPNVPGQTAIAARVVACLHNAADCDPNAPVATPNVPPATTNADCGTVAWIANSDSGATDIRATGKIPQHPPTPRRVRRHKGNFTALGFTCPPATPGTTQLATVNYRCTSPSGATITFTDSGGAGFPPAGENPRAEMTYQLGGPLNVRPTPDTSGTPTGVVAAGQTVTWTCSTDGQLIENAPRGPSNTWLKITAPYQGWVNAGFIAAPYDPTFAPAC